MFLTYFLNRNSFLLTFLLNTISRAQLLCPSVTFTLKLKTHSRHRAHERTLIACFYMKLPIFHLSKLFALSKLRMFYVCRETYILSVQSYFPLHMQII